jgi:hypothetical protein
MLHHVSATFEYFLATSDDEAAGVIDRLAGPSSPLPAPKRGLFRKQSSDEPTAAVEFEVLPGDGIEPVVVLGQLEAIVANKSFDEVLGELGDPVVAAREGSQLVLRVSDSIGPSLSQLSASERRAAAVKWAAIDEFYGMADPEDLVRLIDDFVSFAERGREQGRGLYCWWSL